MIAEGTHVGGGAGAGAPTGQGRTSSRGAVPARRGARPGRNGHGPPCGRRDAGPHGRGQGTAVPVGDRRRREAPAHHAHTARGQGDRPDPQQRRGHRLRRGRRGRPPVDRHGTHRGQVAGRGGARGRRPDAAAGGRGRPRHSRRAALGAPRGHPAPRREAVQRADLRGRPGRADRLRDRPGRGRPVGHLHRHARRRPLVHLAGAGPRAQAGTAGRPVVARRPAVRERGGLPAVRQGVRDRDPDRRDDRAARPAEERGPAGRGHLRAARPGPRAAARRRGCARPAQRRHQRPGEAGACGAAAGGRHPGDGSPQERGRCPAQGGAEVR